MSRAGRGALLVLIILALAGVAFALTRSHRQAEPQRRPGLLLLTSLPLMFGEDFSLKEAGSPVLKLLETRYRVVPISVTSPQELAKGRLLLMAQPLAQTPENLVALDNWVRGGGRILLLADPMLEWPSKRPLGDPLRPSPMFADTGLLAHWGLRLDSPDQRGSAVRMLAGHRVATVSPGALYGSCAISADRFVADCRLGKGRAIVVTDADFVNVADLGQEAKENLPALLGRLGSLARR